MLLSIDAATANAKGKSFLYCGVIMQVFTFLLSAVAFLLLAFALHLLLTKVGNPLLNKLLSITLLSRFVQVCVFLAIDSSYLFLFSALQRINIPLFFLAPACSYLYVRCFIRNESHLRRKDFIHFVPALLALVHVLSFWGDANWESIALQIRAGGQFSVTDYTGLFPSQIFNAALQVLTIGYMMAMWHVVFSSGFIRKKANISKTWLLFYASMSTFFRVQSFVVLIFGSTELTIVDNPIYLTLICAVLLFLMVFVLYQPRILYGYIVLSDLNRNNLDEKSIPVNSENIPVKNKTLNEQQLEYLSVIQGYVEDSLAFLNPDFQMKDLSGAIDIPAHHCSFVLNNSLKKNFRDYINGCRIQHFIKEYPALADKMTVEAVAMQSGFRNVATFYNAFKKETGKMPGAYFDKTEQKS